MNLTDLAILVVEDEAHARASYRLLLRKAGCGPIHLMEDGSGVLPFLSRESVACVLLDLTLPGMDGTELLPRITEAYPDLPVLVLTGMDSVDIAVRCMKHGAFDFMTKPVAPERLMVSIKRALEMRDLALSTRRITDGMGKAALQNPKAFAPILTTDPAMLSLFRYMEAVAPSSHPVLITGETGVGKELAARVLHTLSTRSGPFIAVNIAGLDDAMIADTLFGHAKGAFTGADQKRNGLVDRAAGGTLFLDEVGDLPPNSQVKLLRLLQENEYLPAGSDRPVRASARILAATNRDPEQLKAGHGFRKDLFFRLAPHAVHLPPLRDRIQDLPLLIKAFAKEAAKDLGRPCPQIAGNLSSRLASYAFPGNIRELKGLVTDAVSRAKQEPLSTALFPAIVPDSGPSLPAPDPSEFPTLKQMEAAHIEKALLQENGNQTRAAKLLGISRQTLNRKCQSQKIPPPEGPAPTGS